MTNIDTDGAKSLFKSKTFWFNVLTGLGTLLALPAGLPAAIIPYIPAAQALINIALRMITDQPVRVGPPR